MVHTQGDMVDSIEGNVEQAATQVEAGSSQVQQALQYQVCEKRFCFSMNVGIKCHYSLRR